MVFSRFMAKDCSSRLKRCMHFRWTCILLGRPMTISNAHFDTRFPIPEPTQPDQEAAENGYLPYLTIFRYTLLLGRILDDLNNVMTPMSPERAATHDADLQKWRESWPPDMELTEYAIATSLARTQEESRQRRGMQSLHLIGQRNTFYHRVRSARLPISCIRNLSLHPFYPPPVTPPVRYP